jgi:DnaJ-class molecular chaperone
MGATFYQGTMPKLVKALERIAAAQEKIARKLEEPAKCSACDGTGRLLDIGITPGVGLTGSSWTTCKQCDGTGGTS